jgi:transcriptional regulator with XRE-family HTH domain
MTMINQPASMQRTFDDVDDAPEQPPILPSIGQVSGVTIHSLRQSLGLSYDDLAEVAKISDTDIMAIENGVLQPSNEAIIAIAHKLGVPPEDIAKSPETAVVETETENEPEPSGETALPPNYKSWSKLADTEQKLRAHAARKAADVLREYAGRNVFGGGGAKSVDPRAVITLAQWIVYGQ